MAAYVAFGVAALMMALLMFGLSLLIARAQEHVVKALRARVVQVKQWGGRILILVGVWLIILSVWADTFARIFPV